MDLLNEIDQRAKRIKKIWSVEAYLHQINQFFKIETTYSSNAIKGNTYTLEDTKTILEDGITVGGHTLKEFFEIHGHGKAYDFMFSLIKKRDISEQDILQCHELLCKNIPNFIGPGEYRKTEVLINGNVRILPQAEEVPAEMRKYLKWTIKERDNLHPVMFAAEAQRRLVNIHPFTGGTGRMSRLLMNTFLAQDKLFPVSIPVAKRMEFYAILEQNDSTNFGLYIAGLELQTLKDLMRFFHLE